MFTWTSTVILSLGVAVSLSSSTEWCLCEQEFSTFLAPRLVFLANASSYPGTRGMVLTWAPKSPCDNHHPCTYLSKPLGNVFLNHANPLLPYLMCFSCVKLRGSAFRLHLPARATQCSFALAPTELGVSLYRTGFRALDNEMKEWKYIQKWKKNLSLLKSFPHQIHWVEVTNCSRGGFGIFVTSLWLHRSLWFTLDPFSSLFCFQFLEWHF